MTRAPTRIGYLPLPEEDLQRILSCSASYEKGEEALRKFEEVRFEANRKNTHDPKKDRWLCRLRRYLAFFNGRKTASGWPITPFKFITWAKHDPLLTLKSTKKYLNTMEAARITTHSFFLLDFPELLNLSSKLHLHLDVIQMLNEFETKWAHLVPKTSSIKKKLLETTIINNSTLNLTPSQKITSSQPKHSLKSKIDTKKTKKIELKSKKNKRISIDPNSSLESLQALWGQAYQSDKIKSSNLKPSKKKIKLDHHHETNLQSHHPTASSSAGLNDPFFKKIHRYDELKALLLQDDFLNSFRRHHPNVKSTQQELKQLSEEIEYLTSQTGELSQIASKEVLTICLEIYLDFWTRKEISGFPIQAIKLCVWFDSIQVKRKEAIDMAIAFERIGKRVEDQIDEHQPILFEPPGPLTHSKLWISFLDHFGWRDDAEKTEHSSHEEDANIGEIKQAEGEQDMELESPTSIPNQTHPSHQHHSPTIPRQMSISSIGSSLSSLPHSPCPLLPRLENSLESECIPDPHPHQLDLDPLQNPLGLNHEEADNQKKNKDDHHQHDQIDNNNNNDGDVCYDDDDESTRVCYKRARPHSPQHKQFLVNLRQLIHLFN